MPPAKMLPKSRSANEIGLASSSMMLMGAISVTWPLTSFLAWPQAPRRQMPAAL